MRDIEFLSALICDDVRQEVSGRAIIVGAAPVGPELNSTGETTVSRISFYMEAAFSGLGVVRFRLKSRENDSVPIEVSMDLANNSDVDEEADTENMSVVGTIVFGKEGGVFDGPGLYCLQYKTDETDWTEIRDFYFPPRASES